MSNPVIGAGAYLGLAEEITYGTAVPSSTAWMGPGFNGSTLAESRTRQVAGSLGTHRADPSYHAPQQLVETATEVGGDITWIPHYEGYGTIFLLKHALGAVATTGAGPYDHEITLDQDGVVGFTAQIVGGQHASVNATRVFEGCRISRLEISAQSGQPLSCRATIIGEDAGGMTTVTGTADFSSEAEEILSTHGGILAWNSGNHRFVNWTLVIDNNLTRRPYVGAAVTDCPAPAGLASITFSGTVEWVANDLYTAFRADTRGDGTLTFTGGGNNSMVIDLHNLAWTRCDAPIDGPGTRTFAVEGMCLAGAGAEHGVEITMTNDNTGAIA